MADDTSATKSTFPWLDQLSQRDKRSLIFHLLYAAESYDYQLSAQALADMLNRGFDIEIPLSSTLVETAQHIIDNRDHLDNIYKVLLTNWRFDRLGLCTRLILRYAIWELEHTQTDSSVIINEAIELAKCFAEHDAHKFINGILDELVKKNLVKRPEHIS